MSTGALVPVHDAGSEADARAVVRLLESHEIPAVLDQDIGGATPFAWHVEGRMQVLVPSSMLGEARHLLHLNDYQTMRGGAAREMPPRLFRLRALPAPVGARVSIREEGELDVEIDDEDEGPTDLALPEPSPLRARLWLAMLAIACGSTLQGLAQIEYGRALLFSRLGARAPMMEEPWRFVSAGFLHSSFSHFTSNAMMGVLIGVVLFGTHRIGATVCAWLVSSAVGLGTESVLSPAALIVGASAGNYGLVGLWAKGQLERAQLSLLPRRERMRTIGILLLLVPGALTPFSSTGTKIAIAAHAAGFLAGFLMGYVFHRRLEPSRFASIDRRANWAGGLAMVIVLATLIVAAFELARAA